MHYVVLLFGFSVAAATCIVTVAALALQWRKRHPRKMKRMLVLKTGQRFRLLDVTSFEVSPSDFTKKTVHKFILKSGKNLFVQGDNVAYILCKKGFAWR